VALRLCALGLLALLASEALALDPMTLLLLRMLRDQAASTALESGVNASNRQTKPFAAPPPPAEPLATDEKSLRALIDESFVELSASQREEVYAGLAKILADPNYAQMRPVILGEFNVQARAYRDTRRLWNSLSYADKQALTARAREQYERLPDPQRRQILEALEAGIPGLPGEINDMMRDEFRRVAPAPIAGR
jgi:hypothetical protein